MNFNKVFVAGNLTRDPEARTLPSGQTVVSFGVATNRVWTNQSGEKQEAVEFHNIVAFGKLADICSRYLTKGRLVLIEGRLQTRSWQGQDGIKRYKTEIITDNMQMGPRFFASSADTEQIRKKEQSGNIIKEEIPVIEAEEPAQEESFSSYESKETKETFTESDDKGEIEVKDIPF
jgi:single-strand DNA-binding protein